MNTRAIVVSLLLGALLVGPPVGMPSTVSSAAPPGGATPQYHQATRQAAPPRRHPRLVMPARNVIGSLWTAHQPTRLALVTVPTTATVSQRVTAEIFQGVRNGLAPRGGTLVWLMNGSGNYQDTFWPATYARWYRLGVDRATLPAALTDAAGTMTPTEAITRYVIWDPALPATINVASTIAGVDRVLAIDPADETTGLNLKGMGYHLFLDLRRFHFRTREAAYGWALANLALSTDMRAIAIQGVADHGEDPPDSGARDYAVAAGLFQFSVPPTDALYDRILDAFPQETAVLGFDPTDESLFTYKDSLRGDVGINTALAGNLSCHSAFKPGLSRQPEPDPAKVHLDPTKVYLAFSISDGDAIGLHARFYNPHSPDDPTAPPGYSGLWRDVARGSLPLGWGISPVMTQIQRGVVAQLYAERTPNDYFVSWLPGGYYDYHALPTQARADVLAWNRADMDQAGLRVGWTYDQDPLRQGTFTAEEAAAYVNSIESLGWIQGYGDNAAYFDPERYRDPLFEGRQARPFMFNEVDARGDEYEFTELKINRIADTLTRRPLFLPVNFVIWHVRTIGDLLHIWHDLQRQRPGRYELVTPGELMALQTRYLTHGGTRIYQPALYPGDHPVGHADELGWSATVADGPGILSTGPSWTNLNPGVAVAAFHMMVGNHTADDAPLANVSVVQHVTGAVLGTLTVRRRDFTAPMTFQDFLLPFTVTVPATPIDLRVTVAGRAYLKLGKIFIHTAQVWRGGDPAVRHDVGRLLPDGAWGADPARDKVPGYLIRVPPVAGVPGGVHTAVWRLAVDDSSRDDLVVASLVVYDPDLRRVLASRDVRRQEFALGHRQQDFGVPFVSTVGHRLELRTYYWARAALSQYSLIVRD